MLLYNTHVASCPVQKLQDKISHYCQALVPNPEPISPQSLQTQSKPSPTQFETQINPKGTGADTKIL